MFVLCIVESKALRDKSVIIFISHSRSPISIADPTTHCTIMHSPSIKAWIRNYIQCFKWEEIDTLKV